MCGLQQRMIVNCSIEAATAMLAALLEERGRLAIRPHLMVPRLGIEMSLRRDVVVSAARLAGAKSWHVVWSPADGGTFPCFDGSLHFTPDEGSPETAALTLDGSYALSERAAADPVDRALAHRIEMATARALLGELRGGLERASRRQALEA